MAAAAASFKRAVLLAHCHHNDGWRRVVWRASPHASSRPATAPVNRSAQAVNKNIWFSQQNRTPLTPIFTFVEPLHETQPKAKQRGFSFCNAMAASRRNFSDKTAPSARPDEGTKNQRKKTPLHDLHVELGGRMVDFVGWSLPVQYQGDGIMASHLHTRSKASLFDVSHMGQLRMHGADRVKFLERLVVGDIRSLAPTEARLTLLTNQSGGIIDDCIVTAQASYLGLVINAGRKEEDIEHISSHLQAAKEEGLDVTMEQMGHMALLALQGPEAMKALQPLLPSKVDLRTVPFMSSIQSPIADIEGCTTTRCGYTGEDGFEISVPGEKAVDLARHLLSSNGVDVKMAGLGARDTLRLEAGLCLYGHDLNETTTPVEAGLTWTVGKRRRTEGGFLGWETIMRQIKGGVERKLVGMFLSNKAPAREEAKIFAEGGSTQIGVVTSGTFSPSLLRPIAMGFVPSSHAKPGTKLSIELRGKMVDADVTKMPFVPASYYRLP